MSSLTIIRSIVVWYAMVQVVTLAVLPLTLRVLRGLPDRGYSLAKINSVLLVGVVYWLGYSYGLLRNERGGVWVALFAVGALRWLVGWKDFVAWWRSLRNGGGWRALLATELVFAFAFVGWTLVRAYDPNVDHTEQPMDLMFMNSIWASPTFPPQDAWLAGYAISYYYLGYWLLVTLGRLANTPPSIAYNIGQAVWYGFLWVGCFGIVMNLLVWRFRRQETERNKHGASQRISGLSIAGGVLAGAIVAFAGNMQIVLEWLYANGFHIDGLIRWAAVNDFPEGAAQTGHWFIDNGWWWWRSSRVIADHNLLGDYSTVIDEFPMFSYLLGDNHPHVTAMPVVLLVIGMAMNLLFLFVEREQSGELSTTGWRSWLPLSVLDMAVYLLALGSLVFLNTWDYPPYWLLLVAIIFLASGGNWKRTLATGGVLLLLTVVLYLPYLLSAQSQAGGIMLNAFNPTRFSQFLIMFGSLLPALAGVIYLGWRLATPRWLTIAWVSALTVGAPVALLVIGAMVSASNWGKAHLPQMELPAGIQSYSEIISQRWLSAPWTLLFVAVLLAGLISCLVALVHKPFKEWGISADLVFVLLLGTIGLGLIYAPEFVFLRDNFGTRMNTVFKFYYQGWLLLGLSAAYLIVVALKGFPRRIGSVSVLALASLVLVACCMIFPLAGIYSKTAGFTRAMPTLDSTHYVADGLPDVMAAAAWVQSNTTPGQIVLEGMGGSYNSNHDRISTMTGRPTLLGWDGHERQWRGEAYGGMAQGRVDAIEKVYRTGAPNEIADILNKWGIDYVFVGPAEIDTYGITSSRLDQIASEMDTVFSQGQVRIFRRREG